MNILVTGATGNIGTALIKELLASYPALTVFAAVRDVGKATALFAGADRLRYRQFDYDDPTTFDHALAEIDIVFLLRPPHISNIAQVYEPLFAALKQRGIRKTVLLSVQGAESSQIIPHRKIELLLIKYQFEYIFVRPSYFMQNLTTTLLPDIQKHRKIVLPAGDALFNWIDIADIAEVCALYLSRFEQYKNQAYVVTGNENRNFADVVARINQLTNAKIAYQPVNPLQFIWFQRQNNMKFGMILVMCLLHYLPRFQSPPPIVATYAKLFGREPRTLDSFIAANNTLFT